MTKDLLPGLSDERGEFTLKAENAMAHDNLRGPAALAYLSCSPSREELTRPGKLIDYLKFLTEVGEGYRKHLYFLLSCIFIAGKTIVEVDEAWAVFQTDDWWCQQEVSAPKKRTHKVVFRSLLRRFCGGRNTKILDKYRSLLLNMLDDGISDEHAMEEVEKRGVEKGSYLRRKGLHDVSAPASATMAQSVTTQLDGTEDEALGICPDGDEPELGDSADQVVEVGADSHKQLDGHTIDGLVGMIDGHEFEVYVKPRPEIMGRLTFCGPVEISVKVSATQGGKINLSDLAVWRWNETRGRPPVEIPSGWRRPTRSKQKN